MGKLPVKNAHKRKPNRMLAFIGSGIATCIICVFIAPLLVTPKLIGANLVNASPIENLEMPQKRSPGPSDTSPDATSNKVLKKVAIPDQWTEDEIKEARKICAPILKNANAEFELIDPVRKGACGTPSPVRLSALGTSSRVKISPPATLNCNMVRALQQWLEEKVQPLAKRTFGVPVVEIKNISSYSCRHRYNNPKKRLSEHALANALDIAGLKFADGKTADLLKHWGETKRDRKRIVAKAKARALAKAKAKAKALAKAKSIAKAQAQAKARADTTPEIKTATHQETAAIKAGIKSDKPPFDKSYISPRAALGPTNAVPPSVKASLKIDVPPPAPLDDRARFLRTLHTDACTIFGTVLGPEANEAHRNHYHFDLAPRRRSAYCQ